MDSESFHHENHEKQITKKFLPNDYDFSGKLEDNMNLSFAYNSYDTKFNILITRSIDLNREEIKESMPLNKTSSQINNLIPSRDNNEKIPQFKVNKIDMPTVSANSLNTQENSNILNMF